MSTKFAKYKVRLFAREQVEPEEIFFDNRKIKELEEENLEAEKFEMPLSPFVFNIFMGIQIAALFTLGAISVFMFAAKGEEYQRQAEINSARVFPIFSNRGIIYDRGNTALAQNEIYFDLIINLRHGEPEFGKLREFAQMLSGKLSLDSDEILSRVTSAQKRKFSEVTLVKGLTQIEVEKVNAVLANASFAELRQVSRRRYSDAEIFAHILGYTGEISPEDMIRSNFKSGERVGKAGIEAFYDDELRGKTGMLVKKVNARGEVLSQEIRGAPAGGNDIILSIDYKLQKKIYKILKQHLGELGLEAGAAILMDPRDGKVAALVSVPSFDNNLFEKGISEAEFFGLVNDPVKPMFNRAISGEYPSGSTIKPIIAAAALEENIVSPDFLVYSAGSIFVTSAYNSEVLYEFKDWKAHGWTDIYKAIADSVNIYFYTIGGGYKNQKGLGIKNIEKYLRDFGWGEILGIDLPGERGGLIPSPKWKKETKGENWYIGDTYLASIGQGDILATPLQIAAATSVFANRGALFTPKVVSQIGSVSVPSKILRSNFIKAGNLEVVREGMRRAVTSGSSRLLSALPHPAAGKTGTAQTGRDKNLAWFTGFAPYESPEIVLTVLLEEGDNSNYAVRAALDMFRAYFEIAYPQNSRD